MEFRYMCKPRYPEGDLVRKEDFFWAQNDYDQPITNMDYRIDNVAEQVIDKYLVAGLLADIDDNDRYHLKQYARKLQYFEQKGNMVSCPICDQPHSRGFCWREANYIQVVPLDKRSGSAKADKEEKCHARYNRNIFSKHLEDKKECIYHQLIWEVEEMERMLGSTWGTRVTLYFKKNDTSYATMYKIVRRESGTVPKRLMVDCKSLADHRKWATFYMDGVSANLLAMAIKAPNLRNRFKIKLKDRIGEEVVGWGRDWNPSMPDADVTLHYKDDLELEFLVKIGPMQGNSVATAINTDFCSRIDSSNRVASMAHDHAGRRNAGENGDNSWEHLEDVVIPSKTWYNGVSHTSSSRNDSDLNANDGDTTIPRQGEEWRAQATLHKSKWGRSLKAGYSTKM